MPTPKVAPRTNPAGSRLRRGLAFVVLVPCLLISACSTATKIGAPSEKAKLSVAARAVIAEATSDYVGLSRVVTKAAAGRVKPEDWERLTKLAGSKNPTRMRFGMPSFDSTGLVIAYTSRVKIKGVLVDHAGSMQFTSRKGSESVDYRITSVSGKASTGTVKLRAEEGEWRLLSLTINGTTLDYSPAAIKQRLRI